MIFPLYMHRESAAGVSGYCHGYITTLKQGNRIKYVFTVDCVISYLSGVLALIWVEPRNFSLIYGRYFRKEKRKDYDNNSVERWEGTTL